jgi:hypothetical protein
MGFSLWPLMGVQGARVPLVPVLRRLGGSILQAATGLTCLSTFGRAPIFFEPERENHTESS